MNNEQAQQALENIGSKLTLQMDSSMPSFWYGNEVIGFVSTSSISIYPGGGYLKHKITDEEYSILIQLSHTRLDDRIVNDTFSKFTDSLRRADDSTRTKIINYVKELVASDTNAE
ncbi:hypothetical protein [Liquorilactobacillus mali]|uniref:Uncharacterized protein n=1 Tax=Liquorilactobacillus mali KCTC 3596 = DSM 20444 TaxID=1046596 RepID=J0UV14_9LACO|nr:hypothetical protein [Liquorilactobacillus mali]EJF02146.1 hypothetical protein LMA_00140 [Liquorilactobacillus mali KCTC 3596 = DSM 20444]KRN03462.1 hypothetical protein FD00_GL000506 [Liquorilactobacillus mali KCTC 3596 = DSM 20444]QFQ74547.1 hypothetical protein LM596_05195 [Liquorilactobacillus mali]